MADDNKSITLTLALASDFEELLALRIEAMRESLERIGRFDPIRARGRFQSAFSAAHTRHIEVEGIRLGFVVLKPTEDYVLLDHLYIRPEHQGAGIGSAVISKIIQEAEALQLPLHVGALRDSDANRFYQKHGFVFDKEDEWDIYYVRPLNIKAV